MQYTYWNFIDVCQIYVFRIIINVHEKSGYVPVANGECFGIT